MPTPRARATSASLLELTFLSDPQLSADGRRAVCVRTTIEQPETGPPRYLPQLQELDLEAGGMRPLTHRPWGADGPRFAPDGRRLAFLARAREDGKPQAWLLPGDAGEARRLTDLPAGVEALAWRPDGTGLALLARTEAAPRDPVARSFTRRTFKADGVDPLPDAPRQAWYLDLRDETARPLTEFDTDVGELAWAPDGRHLYLTASESADHADAWRSRGWRLRVTPRGRGRELTGLTDPLLRPAGLAVSADGDRLALLAPCDPDSLSAPPGLWEVHLDAPDAPRLLTGERDAAPSVNGDARHGRYPNVPVADGDGWVVNLGAGGASGPTRVGAGGEPAVLLSGERTATAFAHAAGRTLAIVEAPHHPGEVVLLEGGGERRVTHEHDAQVKRLGFVRASGPSRAANGAAGVPYWRLVPARARRDRALVLQVHGGPHTAYGWGFSFEHQLLAARGYTVVFGNPRGSSGYGQAYAEALLGAYGTVDADDVLAIARAALAEHADPDAPMHLTGGSYGGFMTNWLVGGTEQFRSAVTQRSICNWIGFSGSSDIGPVFARHEVGGPPWRDLEGLWAQSPLSRVEAVRTPVLVLHADADHRCPVDQAEQWYVALKQCGHVDTRLVRFPDEGHELSRSGRPDRRVRRLDEIVGWFEAHA